MYAKIFESIYDGSLRKDWKALVVFQQLLVLADEEGFVDKTPDAISARTTIPIDIIRHGLNELSSPDSESRSREEEGRRIVLIDPQRGWGWRIVNYRSYREIRTKDELRTYWAGKKRGQRSDQRSAELLERMRLRLSIEYNRKPNQVWGYNDLSTLADICRRSDPESEMAELLSFKKVSGRYFPGSITTLLQNWESTLDRSRNRNGHNEEEESNI
jgi:hypothetical protein